MKDALVIGLTVGVFAMAGNIVGGYVIAAKLTQLTMPAATSASSAEIAAERLMALKRGI